MDKQTSLEDIVKNDYQEKTIVNLNVSNKKVGLASDHRGYELRQKLIKYLNNKGYTVIDYGCDDPTATDYPGYGFKLGKAVASGEVDKGIAICGSGIGISIACNKVKGVRCAKVNNVNEAKYTRTDNDANAIALSAKTPIYRAKDIVDVFLTTPFSNEKRHIDRIKLLDNYHD